MAKRLARAPTKPKTVKVTGSYGYIPKTVAAAGNASPLAGHAITVDSTGTAGTPSGVPSYTDPYSAAYSQYQAQLDPIINRANAGYGASILNSYADEGNTALDLGATLGVRDPNAGPGSVTGGSFDWNNVEASNPFSKAALLVRNYNQAKSGTTNSLAAQGQLYSGAMTNAQDNNTFGFQQGQDSLSKVLQNYLMGQSGARAAAGVTRDDTINDGGLSGLLALLGQA